MVRPTTNLHPLATPTQFNYISTIWITTTHNQISQSKLTYSHKPHKQKQNLL